MQPIQDSDLSSMERAAASAPAGSPSRSLRLRDRLARLPNLPRLTRAGLLACCFCVFSVLGHWMEAAPCTLVRLGIVPGVCEGRYPICSNLLAPCPVYGVGMLACMVLLHPVWRRLAARPRGRVAPRIASFLVSAAVCTAIELVMGLLFNHVAADGRLRLWDYSDRFANLMGQIRPEHAIAFGAVSSLITWTLCPRLDRLIQRLSRADRSAAPIENSSALNLPLIRSTSTLNRRSGSARYGHAGRREGAGGAARRAQRDLRIRI